MKQSRYYQDECDVAIKNALSKGKTKLLAVLPTGSGKTFTAVKAIKGMGRILWQTHVEELLDQSAIALLAELDLMPYDVLVNTIKEADGLINLLKNTSETSLWGSDEAVLIAKNIGVVKADMFDIEKPIVIASVQTLHKRLDRIPSNHFDVVVADEAHLFGAITFQKALNHFSCKLRLGLTATPFRMDNMLLADIFDEIVYEYPISKAITDGFLCKPNAIQIRTSADLDGVHTMAGEFNQKELVEKVNTLERNNLIVNKYIEYAIGRPFIAFAVDVEHAIDLKEAFEQKGVKCDYVVGDKELTTDRRGTIEKFKSGELEGLTNVMVLTTGFDFPNTGCVILASPTKSKTKFLQSLGRGLRLKDDNFVAKFAQDCIILDVVDNTTKHKLINTISLDKDLPLEDKIFISDKNRQMLLDVKFKREHSFVSAPRLTDIKIDLLALPKVEISGSMRMQEPATEKMLLWIKSFGYDIEAVHYTKQMCSEIIASQSASDKQIGFLRWKGYDVSNGVSITEASLAFKEIAAKEEKEKQAIATQNINLPFNF